VDVVAPPVDRHEPPAEFMMTQIMKDAPAIFAAIIRGAEDGHRARIEDLAQAQARHRRSGHSRLLRFILNVLRAAGDRQLPWKTGLRFSLKARTPSTASREPSTIAPQRASSAATSCGVSRYCARTVSLMARKASGAPLASRAATRATSASKSAS